MHRRGSGQALVELALSIPFLLICLVAIMYFGRAYFITQTLSFAAQEGAKTAARVPELANAGTRDYVRGFTTGGAETNPASVIYSTLGGAGLLSNGRTGELPTGASVRILPWDASTGDVSPAGTVTVVIEYPFSLLINPFTGQAAGGTRNVSVAMSIEDPNPVPFADFTIRQSATVSPQIYQEGI